jgi:hypothetical protein
MTVEELRAEILQRHEEAKRQIAHWQTAREMAEAELRAHDAAIQAAIGEIDYERPRLGPDNLNGGRASRRNIPEVVYELLDEAPQTTSELADAVGGVKISQIQAALLKLGDKVITKPCHRAGVGEIPGYIRADKQEPQHE